jgi:hypothetical protein
MIVLDDVVLLLNFAVVIGLNSVPSGLNKLLSSPKSLFVKIECCSVGHRDRTEDFLDLLMIFDRWRYNHPRSRLADEYCCRRMKLSFK